MTTMQASRSAALTFSVLLEVRRRPAEDRHESDTNRNLT